MNHSEFREQLYDQFARVGKSVCHGRRIELLELLNQGEHTVESLAHEAGLSVANTSRHLRQMRQSGLVEARKSGQHVHYRLADPELTEIVRLLRSIAERRLVEVRRLMRSYLGELPEDATVDSSELVEAQRQGTVTLLDVRPEAEYRSGHIPGAISTPLADLGARIPDLPRDRRVVVYCRGPYGILAREAVNRLSEEGFTATRLADGLPEWRHAGRPID